MKRTVEGSEGRRPSGACLNEPVLVVLRSAVFAVSKVREGRRVPGATDETLARGDGGPRQLQRSLARVLGGSDRARGDSAANGDRPTIHVQVIGCEAGDLAEARTKEELEQGSVTLPALKVQEDSAGLGTLKDRMRFLLPTGRCRLDRVGTLGTTSSAWAERHSADRVGQTRSVRAGKSRSEIVLSTW